MRTIAAVLMCSAWVLPAQEWRLVFADAFAGKLDRAWTWVREKPEARKIAKDGIQLRHLSGTLWAKDNSGSNMLVRPMPSGPAVSTEVTLTNKPELMNEQAGLIWYGGDGDYIKLVKEMKEQPYVILGREESEAAKTYGRIPMPSDTVELKLTLAAGKIVAQARVPGAEWKQVGECAALSATGLRAGVFASVLPGETDRWATFRDFRILAPTE